MDAIKALLKSVFPNTSSYVGGGIQSAKNLPLAFSQDEEKKKKAAQQALETLSKKQAAQGELASLAIPFGTGKNIASKFLLPGATTGVASAAGEKTGQMDLLKAGLGGAAGGGVLGAIGKAGGAVGKAITQGAEDLGLRKFGLTSLDLNKLEGKLGEKVPDFLRKNNLFAKGAADVPEAIKPLQQAFDEIANSGNLKVDKLDLLKGLKSKVDEFSSAAAPELQKKGADIQQYANNLFGNLGENVTAGDITKERRVIDQLVKDFTKSGDSVNASKNRVIRDVLQKVVQGSADKSGLTGPGGQSLKDIGSQLSKLYEFGDVAAKRANKDVGTNPFGLLQGLGVGGAAIYSGQDGFSASDIPAIVTGGVLPRVMNNPKLMEGAAKAGMTVGQGMQNQLPDILTQLLGQGASRAGGNMLSGIPANNAQNTSQDNSKNESVQNNVNATSNNPNIAQTTGQSNDIDPNMEITLNDGTKATYGQLQQQGAFQQQDQQSQSPITDEQWQQLFIADLMQNGGKNLDKLQTVQQLLSPQQASLDDQYKALQIQQMQKEMTQGKPLGAEEQKMALNAVSGLRSTKAIEDSLNASGGAEGLGQILPDFLGGDQAYQSSKTNLADVIGRLRSGGAIGVEEEKRFNRLLPSVGKSKETNAKDLAELKKLLGQFADPRQAQASNEEFLMQYLGI